MIKSSFFNSVLGDRKYNASSFAEYFNSFIGNGVFPIPTDGLKVISNNDMTVTLKTGKAWINGYLLVNDDDYILNIDVADGILKRIDRVVVQFDTVGRAINVLIKKGTLASNPVAPVLIRDTDFYELGIADILISNGAVSIVTANITDLRSNTSLCGKVDSLIAGDINSLSLAFNQHNGGSAISDVHGLKDKVIEEVGTNANGNYIKYGDGTLICYRNWTFNDDIRTIIVSGSIYVSVTLRSAPFPYTFVDNNIAVTASARCVPSTGTRRAWVSASEIIATRFNYETIATGNSGTSDVTLSYIAIGRWK